MSGTEEPPAAPAAISAEDRAELARLRTLLANPGSIQVLHSDQARRIWLSDNTVLLDVTGNPVIDPGLDDGLYRLVTTRGLVRKPGIPTWNLPVFFGNFRHVAWLPAWPTPFSITDSEAKAMLVYADGVPLEGGRTRIPLAINEDLWHAFKRVYPLAAAWHAGWGGPFRVSVPGNDELAYIQQIRIPIDLHDSVQAMLEVLGAERKADPESAGGENPALRNPVE